MVSLYIHIPFCEKKCPYCSFAVCVASSHRVDEYLDALALEAKQYQGTVLKTIYIGGGTPSYLKADQLEKLGEIVHKNFVYREDAEFTLEANPTTFDFSKAELIHRLGVNRISLGVQSLNEKYLKYLGRTHSPQEAREAFQELRKSGFSNINLDLMFSFPHQTTEELEKDVDEITALNSEHLSLYSLNIEEKSLFSVKKVELDDDVYRAGHYSRIVELLEAKGFIQYEVSNFAKPGQESQHNKIYWQGGNYIGLGMAAHSHWDGHRFWNVSRLNEYLLRMKEGASPKESEETLDPSQRLMETLLFGLRMNEGVKIEELQERFSCSLNPKTKEIIQDFVENGFLLWSDGDLRTTKKGRLVLDELCSRLI